MRFWLGMVCEVGLRLDGGLFEAARRRWSGDAWKRLQPYLGSGIKKGAGHDTLSHPYDGVMLVLLQFLTPLTLRPPPRPFFFASKLVPLVRLIHALHFNEHFFRTFCPSSG